MGFGLTCRSAKNASLRAAHCLAFSSSPSRAESGTWSRTDRALPLPMNSRAVTCARGTKTRVELNENHLVSCWRRHHQQQCHQNGHHNKNNSITHRCIVATQVVQGIRELLLYLAFSTRKKKVPQYSIPLAKVCAVPLRRADNYDSWLAVKMRGKSRAHPP